MRRRTKGALSPTHRKQIKRDGAKILMERDGVAVVTIANDPGAWAIIVHNMFKGYYEPSIKSPKYLTHNDHVQQAFWIGFKTKCA